MITLHQVCLTQTAANGLCAALLDRINVLRAQSALLRQHDVFDAALESEIDQLTDLAADLDSALRDAKIDADLEFFALHPAD